MSEKNRNRSDARKPTAKEVPVPFRLIPKEMFEPDQGGYPIFSISLPLQ